MTAIARYLRRTLLPLVNVGTVSWLLHRLSGIALAVYLVLHIVSINAARAGAVALDAELAFYKTPFFAAAEWALVGVVAFHALNGLRLIAIDFLDLSRHQKWLFWCVMALCAAVFLAASLLFLPRILGAGE